MSTSPTLPEPYKLIEFDTLDSTNLEALRRAQNGAPGGLWIIARTQEAGRGREGRKWLSGEGNLIASLLLRPGCSLATALQLSLVAAVAAHRTLDRLIEDRNLAKGLKLKWPNDLLLSGRKIAGILLESATDTKSGSYYIVIGTGLNLAWHPAEIDQPAIDLRALGCQVSRKFAFEVFAEETAACVDLWNNGKGFPQIRSEWINHAIGIGLPVKIRVAGKYKEGIFTGIDDTGALILQSDKKTEELVTAGDLYLPAHDDRLKDFNAE